ncbi:MAG: hypothetical protein H6622_03210 [Halobacteriovoraceae bacterium]|nr:hypothetical protein [Halobacteriovoraceae bacterium]
MIALISSLFQSTFLLTGQKNKFKNNGKFINFYFITSVIFSLIILFFLKNILHASLFLQDITPTSIVENEYVAVLCLFVPLILWAQYRNNFDPLEEFFTQIFYIFIFVFFYFCSNNEFKLFVLIPFLTLSKLFNEYERKIIFITLVFLYLLNEQFISTLFYSAIVFYTVNKLMIKILNTDKLSIHIEAFITHFFVIDIGKKIGLISNVNSGYSYKLIALVSIILIFFNLIRFSFTSSIRRNFSLMVNTFLVISLILGKIYSEQLFTLIFLYYFFPYLQQHRRLNFDKEILLKSLLLFSYFSPLFYIFLPIVLTSEIDLMNMITVVIFGMGNLYLLLSTLDDQFENNLYEKSLNFIYGHLYALIVGIIVFIYFRTQFDIDFFALNTLAITGVNLLMLIAVLLFRSSGFKYIEKLLNFLKENSFRYSKKVNESEMNLPQIMRIDIPKIDLIENLRLINKKIEITFVFAFLAFILIVIL